MKIAVYAFSNTGYFFEKLIKESQARRDDIEWSVVLPRWHHRKIFERLLPPERIVYLYEHFDAIYDHHSDSEPTFGFASDADSEMVCLLKDKLGYRLIDSDEQLRQAATIVAIYREFLERERPDYMLFPDLEVVDGFLLHSLCKSMGIVPICYAGMRTLGGAFFAADCYESLPTYFGNHDEKDIKKATEFLDRFLEGNPEPLTEPEEQNSVFIRIKPLWKRAITALAMHLRYERKYIGEDNFTLRLKANFSKRIAQFYAWRFKIFQLRWFHLQNREAKLPRKYVFYALQVTPESSINGLEPYYVDQTRAIDLLLAGLPSGYHLVVKEHPAFAGFRSTSFYRALRRKPGLVLAAPDIPSRRCLENAALVASVTGTVGLEGFLLGRPCLLFGRNFFIHLCTNSQPPALMGDLIRSLINQPQMDVDQRRTELARLIHIRYPILLADPVAMPAAMTPANISAFLNALHDHIQRLGSIHLRRSMS